MRKGKHHYALPVGYKLHWYEIQSVLGRGGFGITYLAQDKNLNRPVAIKEYLPVDLAHRDQTDSVKPLDTDDEKEYSLGLKRFLSEAQTLARFEHPNIVRVFAVFEENNTGYMIMNYEAGIELQSVLENKRTLNEGEIMGIVMPLLDGLEIVHEAGFIHRDIKPQNILIRPDGSPVLIDFGSAREALDGSRARTMTSMVTPGYAPYEQYQSKSDTQGPWTDIYALASVMYRCILGRPPISAVDRSQSIIESGGDLLVSAKEIGEKNYSASFLKAIDHGLAFKTMDRPQSLREWKREFKSVKRPEKLVRLKVSDSPARDDDATTQISRKKRVINITNIIVLTAVLASGVFIYSKYGDVADREGVKSMQTASTNELQEQQLSAREQWEKEKAIVEKMEMELSQRKEQLLKLENVELPSVVELRKKEQEAVKGIESELVNRRNALSLLKLRADEEQKLIEEKARIEQERKLAEEQARQKRLLEEQKQQEINALLDLAQDDLKQSRLTTPVGKNAYYRYQQVLKLDPGNSDAKTGIQAVTNQLVSQAGTAIQEGNLDRAQVLLKEAENISPNADKLTGTRKALEQKQVEHKQLLAEQEAAKTALLQEQQEAAKKQENNRIITDLIAGADKDIEALRLSSPEGNNALEKYKQVLSMDPANSLATRGIQNIVDRYIELAKTAAAGGSYDNAVHRLDIAENIMPGAENIQYARDEIELSRKKEEERNLAEVEKQKAAEIARQEEEQRLENERAKQLAEERSKQDIQGENTVDTGASNLATIEKQKPVSPPPPAETVKYIPPAMGNIKTVLLKFNGYLPKFNTIGLDEASVRPKVEDILRSSGLELVTEQQATDNPQAVLLQANAKINFEHAGAWLSSSLILNAYTRNPSVANSPALFSDHPLWSSTSFASWGPSNNEISKVKASLEPMVYEFVKANAGSKSGNQITSKESVTVGHVSNVPDAGKKEETTTSGTAVKSAQEAGLKKLIIQYSRIDRLNRYLNEDDEEFKKKINRIMSDAGFEVVTEKEILTNPNILTMDLRFSGEQSGAGGFWSWNASLTVTRGAVEIWKGDYQSPVGPNQDVKPAKSKFSELVNKFISEYKG